MSALSVVVPSVNGLPWIEGCLQALSIQQPRVEAIVVEATGAAARELVRQRFPEVLLIERDGPVSVPELRAAGIAAASSQRVAVIEDHVFVRPGWAAALVAAHDAGADVAGGGVENLTTDRLRDWAAFFCEYAGAMAPLPNGEVDALPGMNVSYSRGAIEAMAPLLDEQRWETWIHPHLRRAGMRFVAAPGATVDHAKGFGVREFAGQRWYYSRAHAGERNAQLGPRRWLYAAGSPLLLPLLYVRLARAVIGKRRHLGRFAAATPLVLVYLAVWAAGEAVGYALGGGQSILRVR